MVTCNVHCSYGLDGDALWDGLKKSYCYWLDREGSFCGEDSDGSSCGLEKDGSCCTVDHIVETIYFVDEEEIVHGVY